MKHGIWPGLMSFVSYMNAVIGLAYAIGFREYDRAAYYIGVAILFHLWAKHLDD